MNTIVPGFPALDRGKPGVYRVVDDLVRLNACKKWREEIVRQLHLWLVWRKALVRGSVSCMLKE